MGTQPHSAHSFTYQWPLCIRTELSGCDRLYVLQTQKYLLYSSFFKKHKLFFFFLMFICLFGCIGSQLQQPPQLWHAGSVVVVCGLSCPVACGVLVLRPGIRPVSPAPQGSFLTSEPAGESLYDSLQKKFTNF